ncbi:MAG: 3-deoxy-manno-octulosonate cytidylyltransferase, partial [Prevotella sp.]|nr:3-deoxy-manno-octulosonate cytidylyltransferase [Prevotella sp.]
IDNHNNALYFSRSVIPFVRGINQSDWLSHYPFLKHVGLYAYRTETLREISKLPVSSLELAERLEQLRWLQNGYRIKVCITDIETISIDTPQDLVKAEEYLKQINL